MAANYALTFSETDFQEEFGNEKGDTWIRRLNEGLAACTNECQKDRALAIFMSIPFAYPRNLHVTYLSDESSVAALSKSSGSHYHNIKDWVSEIVKYSKGFNISGSHILLGCVLNGLILPSGVLVPLTIGQHALLMGEWALCGIVKEMGGTVAISENCLRTGFDNLNKNQVEAVQSLWHMQHTCGMEELRCS